MKKKNEEELIEVKKERLLDRLMSQFQGGYFEKIQSELFEHEKFSGDIFRIENVMVPEKNYRGKMVEKENKFLLPVGIATSSTLVTIEGLCGADREDVGSLIEAGRLMKIGEYKKMGKQFFVTPSYLEFLEAAADAFDKLKKRPALDSIEFRYDDETYSINRPRTVRMSQLPR